MKQWDALREAAAKQRKLWDDGLAQTPETIAPLVRSILGAFDHDEPPPPDVTLHGALLTLVGPRPMYKATTCYDEVCALHVTMGLDFAIDAIVESTRYVHKVASLIGRYAEEFAWIDHSERDREPPIEPWIPLRAAIANANAAEKKKAVARALDHAKTAQPSMRFALAWVFPDEPLLFTAEDARYGLTCEEDPGTFYDLASIRNVDLEVKPAKDAWGLVNLPTARILWKELGARALPQLRRFVTFSTYDPEAQAIELVAGIGGPEATRILAEAAHREKDVLPKLLAVALADRASAAAAIEPLLAAPARAKRSRWRTYPLLRPTLETLLAMVKTNEVAKAAPPAALPSGLANPPWAARPQAKPPKTAKPGKAEAPKRVVHEERLEWGSRDPKSIFHLNVALEEDVLARLKAERAEDKTFFMHTFMWVRDATALRLLEEIPVSDWYGGADDVEAMLARFGLGVLDPMLAYVKRQPDRFPALHAVDSPRVAVLAAHLYATSKKNSDDAKKWLRKFPRAAAVGLVAALATEKGKTKESIVHALSFLRDKAEAEVDAVLAASGAAALVEETRSVVAKKTIKMPKLPAFVELGVLPRPALKSGSPISLEATTDLVKLLAISDRRSPRPEIGEIADALDPASLDRFAWGVFVMWLAAGGPPKNGFGLDVMGTFGSAQTLRTLAEAAREWAPGGLPSRAQAVCDVLALAKGNAGLASIHRLTQVRSRALAKHAEKVLAAAAAARGIGKEDLVDQLVPDLGLEADGTMKFDYGERSFSLGFDEHMAPFVTDATGKKLADLPKPATEEEEVANAAVAQWKEVKKKAKAIVREQARRLEVALATERRFSVDHFETSFASHPLLLHLARRLVWGAYRGDNLAFAFRLAEDGTYAGIDDDEIALAPDLEIGLVHPLRLAGDEARKWGSRLADYTIIQPFEQLSRTTHAVSAAEKRAMTLDRVAGKVVPTGKVLGLDKRGWVRTDPIQGGRVHAWQKQARGHAAFLTLDPGIYLGAPLDDPKQTLGQVGILPATQHAERAADLAGTVLGAVDPVFFSELVRDLETLLD